MLVFVDVTDKCSYTSLPIVLMFSIVLLQSCLLNKVIEQIQTLEFLKLQIQKVIINHAKHLHMCDRYNA